MPKKPKGEGNVGRCATPGLRPGFGCCHSDSRSFPPLRSHQPSLLDSARAGMRTFLAALFLFHVFLIQNSFSATLSSNGTVADITAKQALAQNGDTITIPAGTFLWAKAVNITKAITLQGAGVGVTIVKDAGGLIHWTLVAGTIFAHDRD